STSTEAASTSTDWSSTSIGSSSSPRLQPAVSRRQAKEPPVQAAAPVDQAGAQVLRCPCDPDQGPAGVVQRLPSAPSRRRCPSRACWSAPSAYTSGSQGCSTSSC